MVAAFVTCAAALAAAGPASAASLRPPKPSPLRIVSTSPDTVVLAWKRTARRFAVSKNLRRQAVVRTRVYRFHNLRCGTSFRFGVRAINRAGRLSLSASIRARTRSCPPVPDDGPPVVVYAPACPGPPPSATS